MIYDDFQILSNEEYQILNSNFNKNKQFDRKTIITKICQKNLSCQSICLNIEKDYNIKIKNSLVESISKLKKIQENICSTFNVSSKYNNNIKAFNIFTFLKSINDLIKLFYLWHNTENKEYYKNIARKSINDLLSSYQTIFDALESSNVTFFKFM